MSDKLVSLVSDTFAVWLVEMKWNEVKYVNNKLQ
jgi:hypothetical protein